MVGADGALFLSPEGVRSGSSPLPALSAPGSSFTVGQSCSVILPRERHPAAVGRWRVVLEICSLLSGVLRYCREAFDARSLPRLPLKSFFAALTATSALRLDWR